MAKVSQELEKRRRFVRAKVVMTVNTGQLAFNWSVRAGVHQPAIGASGYKFSKLIPEGLKGLLPTIEEIEAELGGVR